MKLKLIVNFDGNKIQNRPRNTGGIITCCTDMTTGVRRPGNTIDTGSVVVESGYRGTGDPHI